jgi:hypothetical protein
MRRRFGVRELSIALSATMLFGAPALGSGPSQKELGPPVQRTSSVRPQRGHVLKPFAGRPASASSAEPVTDNFEILGHVRLGGKTSDADVWLERHGANVGKYAYVGTWSIPCTGRGVKIVNVNRPKRPKLVAVAAVGSDRVSHEDPVVVEIGNRHILGVGIQGCAQGGRGGLALFDVTNPKNPRKLSFFPTGSNGVHELDMVMRPDGRALALLAVPFGEVSGTADLQILDVTRPRNPTKLSDWGIILDSTLPIPSTTNPSTPMPEVTTCCQGMGDFADFFFHSVRAADQGNILYASHWDAGVIKFDISDPTAPRVIGRTTYPFDADGDAHSMTPYDVGGTRYILQNDEDFQPLSPAHITTSVTGSKVYAALEEPWMPAPLTTVGTVSGLLHDAGEGCDVTDYEGADGDVVLIDALMPLAEQTPPCGLGRQILLAARAGAAAVVINLVGSDRPPGFYQPGPRNLKRIRAEADDLPVLAIGAIDGLAHDLRTEGAGAPITVTLEPQTPSWGFLRIFNESTGHDEDGDGVVEYEQVGSFSGLPHVTGEYPAEPGFWSIHNTEVWGDRAYSSWYSHGIVALDLSDPTAPAMVGQFVPPARGRDIGLPPTVTSVWGVAIDRTSGLIYASDERSGLWIVRPTGPAAPTE